MQFASDPKLEARIGRVCLVYAQVEHAVGHLVASAHGHWSSIKPEYIAYASDSGKLARWMKAVALAYPEIAIELGEVCCGLTDLKVRRDSWAHSAMMLDLFVMMEEHGRKSMRDSQIEWGKLLNGKRGGHIEAPTDSALEGYVLDASAVGDSAEALGLRLAQLAGEKPRPVKRPR